jgi:hypothetical protein
VAPLGRQQDPLANRMHRRWPVVFREIQRFGAGNGNVERCSELRKQRRRASGGFTVVVVEEQEFVQHENEFS